MVSEKEVKQWYNRKHSIKGKDAWRPYEAYPGFLDYLRAQPGKSILDVGCGTGYFLKAADKRQLKTYGTDISDESVKIAKKVSPNSKITIGKGEQLKFPKNSFDYVTCLGALEHFLDVKKGVQEMVRVGKDGALYCIVVPNVSFLYWKLKGSKGTDQQDINENLFSLKRWKQIFTKEGLQVVKIYQDDWFMHKTKVFSSLNPLGIIKRTVFKLGWMVLPLNYTYQFVFVLRKRS